MCPRGCAVVASGVASRLSVSATTNPTAPYHMVVSSSQSYADRPLLMRATRVLLRRRTHLMRTRSELLAHVQHTNSQYNLPEIGKKIAYKANREGVAEHFEEAAVPKTIEVDLALITYDDT